MTRGAFTALSAHTVMRSRRAEFAELPRWVGNEVWVSHAHRVRDTAHEEPSSLKLCTRSESTEAGADPTFFSPKRLGCTSTWSRAWTTRPSSSPRHRAEDRTTPRRGGPAPGRVLRPEDALRRRVRPEAPELPSSSRPCSPPTPSTATGSASSSARRGRVPASGSSTTAWGPRRGCPSEGYPLRIAATSEST